MACTIEEIVELDPSEFDKQLGNILVKYEGNSQQFLETVLGFLKRKSNFFKEGDPKKKLLDAYKSVAGDGSDAGLKGGFLASKPEKKQKNHSETEAPAAPPAPAATPEPAPAPAAVDEAPSTSSPASASAQPPVTEVEDEPEEDTPKGVKPNSQRGCDYGHYSWGQTLSEVTLLVPVPPGSKARSLDVVISKAKLKVGVKGAEPIIDGEPAEAIKVDDCLWNIVDNCVEVTLTKAEGMHWWKHVIKSDPEIDVQKVEPENSNLKDLDADTRQTVEKMMFDQRQKAMGLPTSEELQRQEMLKKFMAAHPEMDFSKAKMM